MPNQIEKDFKSTKLDLQNNTGKTFPEVMAKGYLPIFDNIPCYVLSTGIRGFRLSDMTFTLRGKAHGKFGNYLAAKNINKYLPDNLKPLKDIDNDRRPQGLIEAYDDGKILNVFDSEDFIEVCIAFVDASDNDYESLSDSQKEIVSRAKRFIKSTAKIGIRALIDEATGYQYIRPKDDLSAKLVYLLSEDMRTWESTFPDDLWREFGRLTNWKGSLKKRPKYWGKLVNELIYDNLDKDVAKYLRENKPPKLTGQKYHQWFNKERGVKELINLINRIIGLAIECNSIDELRYKANKHFGKGILQLRLDYYVEGQERLIASSQTFDTLLNKASKPLPLKKKTKA